MATSAPTVRQHVELVYEEALVLCPGHIVSIWGEEVMDTLLSEDLSVRQRGNIVNSSGLDWRADSGLNDTEISKTVRRKAISMLQLLSVLTRQRDAARRPICGRNTRWSIMNTVCNQAEASPELQHQESQYRKSRSGRSRRPRISLCQALIPFLV